MNEQRRLADTLIKGKPGWFLWKTFLKLIIDRRGATFKGQAKPHARGVSCRSAPCYCLCAHVGTPAWHATANIRWTG